MAGPHNERCGAVLRARTGGHSTRGVAAARAGCLLLSLSTLGCYDGVFPSLDGGLGALEDGYAATLETSPEHAHPGDVLTLIFFVSKDGVPLDGLSPEIEFEQSEGGTASGTLESSPGDGPGEYVAKRAFQAGTYLIRFRFESDGRSMEQTMEVFVEGHG